MRAALAAVLVAAALVLAGQAHASPGRVAVGAADGVPIERVAEEVARITGAPVDRTLDPLGAVVVSVPNVEAAIAALAGVPGVAYVEPVERSRRLAFTPNDPLAFFQWYLSSVRAFDFWEAMPSDLTPVRVAIIDSGVEGDHPDLQGRIVGSRSFVGGRATEDEIGHGTLIAGEIAALTDNALGVAGIGIPVELLVAKVVDASGGITIEAEAKAIRWAVDNGAQVINLSLGGRRDPNNPALDQYSALEQDAVEYAYANGAVIVAATGNCQGPPCPYGYASYPAALPHVIGVSAMTQSGTAASFSNRDPVYNDLIAPGTGIISTFPSALTDPKCPYRGFSLCALPPYRTGDGTSFAAPLVTAAAALLLGQRPSLTQSQVMKLLRLSATDLGPTGRDAAFGAGLVNIEAALRQAVDGPTPVADAFELSDAGTRTNGDAGKAARSLYGSRPKLKATVDYFDDPNDVYRVYLRQGRLATLDLTTTDGSKPTLVLWRLGTKHVTDVTKLAVRTGRVLAYRKGSSVTIRHRVTKTGWYHVEVKAPSRDDAVYRLAIAK